MLDLEPSSLETVARLLLAAAAGTIVGWEREVRRRPAGLRTHVLVAVGACAFILIALQLHVSLTRGDGFDPLWDLLRVVAGVATGVGFLGAGVILERRQEVRGLTTAAGIWVVAALGTAAAVGSYWVLGTGVAITLFTLAVLRRLERRIFENGDEDD